MRDMVLSNGRLAATFDSCGRLRDLHHPGVGLENHAGGRVCALGIDVLGCVLWVDETWQRIDEDGAEATLLAPWDGVALHVEDCIDRDLDVLVRRITVSSRREDDLAVRLLVHHDLVVGGNEVGNGVRYDPQTESVLHYRRDHWFLVGGAAAGEVGVREWSLARDDDNRGRGVRAGADDTELDRNPTAVGAGESLIALRAILAGGAEVEFETWLAAGTSYDEVKHIAGHLRRERPQRVPRRAPVTLPWRGGLDDPGPRAAWLAERSLDLVLAHVDRGGGIVASLDSGLAAEARESYAYVWPRDAALIADVLVEAGQPDVARRFAGFACGALSEEGWLHQRYHVDGAPASTWHAAPEVGSPLRPIQEDETALTLRTACRFADDDAIWTGLIVPAAMFLAAYRDPETGLPLPSHDLWEERHGVHAFTTAAVSGALSAAAAAAETRGDPRAANWRAAGEEVLAALDARFFHDDAGRFARTAHPEEGALWLDATADASLLLLHRVEPRLASSPRVAATIESVAAALEVEGLGLARYEGDTYHQRVRPDEGPPGNPWIIATLWLADWRIDRAENLDELEAARDLVTLVADLATPSGALPEQLHPLTGEHLSVRPLAWSHAAFLSTHLRYRRKLERLLGVVASDDGRAVRKENRR